MSAPLALAAPAAAAGLAYLNARWLAGYDALLLRSIINAYARANLRERRDRLNQFYVLEERAKTKSSANKNFIVFEDRSHTYAQVYDAALRYGTWFKQRFGIKPGDIVALDFQNSDTFLFLVFGLWAIGAKPAFMNYNLTGKGLAHCVRTATAKLVIVDPAVMCNVDDALRAELGPGVDFVELTPAVEAEVMATRAERWPDQDRHEDLQRNMAILIYTSGTTGMPKAAIVSWSKLIVGGNFAAWFMGHKSTDVFYTSMPLYHSSATILGLCPVLAAGSTLAVGRKFSTKLFWPEARKHNATIIQYVGETCRYLLAAPPEIDAATGEDLDKKHRVRMAFGNGLRPDVWNRFKERFGIDTIVEFYAATEGSFGTWNRSSNDFSVGAVGRGGALYGAIFKRSVAVARVDSESPEFELLRDAKTGLCQRVEPSEVGEMLFKLPEKDPGSKFQGYFNNDKATQSKILRDVFSKGDAWFRTGDLVVWDEENRVYFRDRVGDTFRWKSENVSTAEVAEAVGTHPRVHEANVYGVTLPHHDGRAGCAALVLHDADPTKKVDVATLRSIAAHMAGNLPKYARPLFLRVVRGPDGLAGQTTGTNKQQKHMLRAQGIWPPGKGGTGEDEIFWLKGDSYVKFEQKEWNDLCGGRVKL